jgi:hypothetical protein
MEHRPRLTQEEYELIKAWRDRGHLPELFEQCKAAGIELKDVKHYWHKSEKFSIFAKNEGQTLEDTFAPILEELQSYSPKFEKIEGNYNRPTLSNYRPRRRSRW